MPDIICCPDFHDLQKFSLGQLPASEIERIERHLGACSSCLAALEQLASADSLVDVVRAQAATPAPLETSVVRELMARLQSQPPSAALEATAELAALPVPPSEDATLAPDSIAATPANAERGRYDFLAPAEKAEEIGRLGPYRILQLLGRGGMGVVFRAEDLQAGTHRSRSKVMLPAMAATASARERFLREARDRRRHRSTITSSPSTRSARIAVCPIWPCSCSEGESLDDRLQREGRLPVAEVLRIGREIASGLAAAH